MPSDCCWSLKSKSKGLQNTHLLLPSLAKHSTISNVFSAHQSFLPSEIIYFKHGHKEVQRRKRRREKKGKVNKQIPVECLSSLTGTCKWSPLSLSLSPLTTAAGKEGNASVESIQVSTQLQPPSFLCCLWSSEETLTLWWQPPLYELCLQTPGVLWWHLERARDS